ncbi:MAG TPA: hypothetical protein VHA82_10525 [Ramlibacter sp.]|uniref:hypothetical protein n=1 Tax=Ramlibacter sp. TaxID=1917967 RepID=UPI002BDBDD50|nr:hypothetical protein [Ramlibacter sp.]HVZ44232.1 hypothetical protein [Ramlibacter sp.]
MAAGISSIAVYGARRSLGDPRRPQIQWRVSLRRSNPRPPNWTSATPARAIAAPAIFGIPNVSPTVLQAIKPATGGSRYKSGASRERRGQLDPLHLRKGVPLHGGCLADVQQDHRSAGEQRRVSHEGEDAELLDGVAGRHGVA